MSHVFGPVVAPASDRSASSWVQERFDWHLVCCVGFSEYLRIDHGHRDDENSDGSAALVSAIAEVGARHTSTPERAHFGVWEGHGWAGTSVYWAELRPQAPPSMRVAAAIRRRRLLARDRRRQLADRRRLDQQLALIPSFELPLRRYHLLTGPVSAAAGIRSPADGAEPQLPDLWWPDDRAWLVSTDTDLAVTVIAGSDAFVSALVAALPDLARRWHGRDGHDDEGATA